MRPKRVFVESFCRLERFPIIEKLWPKSKIEKFPEW